MIPPILTLNKIKSFLSLNMHVISHFFKITLLVAANDAIIQGRSFSSVLVLYNLTALFHVISTPEWYFYMAWIRIFNLFTLFIQWYFSPKFKHLAVVWYDFCCS